MTGPKLRPLCAADELDVPRRARSMLPWLLEKGLSPEDGIALSYNAALLSLALEDGPSEWEVLERYSLSGIAGLCERLERREEASENESWEEWA